MASRGHIPILLAPSYPRCIYFLRIIFLIRRRRILARNGEKRPVPKVIFIFQLPKDKGNRQFAHPDDLLIRGMQDHFDRRRTMAGILFPCPAKAFESSFSKLLLFCRNHQCLHGLALFWRHIKPRKFLFHHPVHNFHWGLTTKIMPPFCQFISLGSAIAPLPGLGCEYCGMRSRESLDDDQGQDIESFLVCLMSHLPWRS